MQFIYMYDRKFIKLVSNVLRMKVQATYELFRILIGKNRNIIEIETISTCNPVFLSTRDSNQRQLSIIDDALRKFTDI